MNKPRGLVVHPAPGHWHGTLVNAVLHHLRDAPLPGAAERPGVVHRLDVDTTGVLAVAKSSMAFAALSQAFAARQVEKSYLAVVLGAPRRLLAGHLIEAPIGRCCADRRRMAVTQQGREAASYVRAVARDGLPALGDLRSQVKSYAIYYYYYYYSMPIYTLRAYGCLYMLDMQH